MFRGCTLDGFDLVLDVAWGTLAEDCGVYGLLMSASVAIARDMEGQKVTSKRDQWDHTYTAAWPTNAKMPDAEVCGVYLHHDSDTQCCDYDKPLPREPPSRCTPAFALAISAI
jgi:hypothetical protein